MNRCEHSDPFNVASDDPMFMDLSVSLGQGDARESDARNYIIAVHAPIFRNPLGGPSEGPTPSGMNDRIMPIIEARAYDLAPVNLQGDANNALPDMLDESANGLDEGYIAGDFQAA